MAKVLARSSAGPHKARRRTGLLAVSLVGVIILVVLLMMPDSGQQPSRAPQVRLGFVEEARVFCSATSAGLMWEDLRTHCCNGSVSARASCVHLECWRQPATLVPPPANGGVATMQALRGDQHYEHAC